MQRLILSRNIRISGEMMQKFGIILIFNLFSEDDLPISTDDVNSWFARRISHDKQIFGQLELLYNASQDIIGATAILFSGELGYDLFRLVFGMYQMEAINVNCN